MYGIGTEENYVDTLKIKNFINQLRIKLSKWSYNWHGYQCNAADRLDPKLVNTILEMANIQTEVRYVDAMRRTEYYLTAFANTPLRIGMAGYVTDEAVESATFDIKAAQQRQLHKKLQRLCIKRVWEHMTVEL